MKVYIVIKSVDHEGEYFKGVFSTINKANEYAAECAKAYCESWSLNDMRIQESRDGMVDIYLGNGNVNFYVFDAEVK